MSDLRWFPPSLIDETALVSVIRDLPRFGTVRYSVGTDSTQSRALDVLHRLDARGISFVTESQDAGRGRAGRRWSAPPASGLLFSTILPHELDTNSLPAVGFWSSLAVVDSVASVCKITLDMKWPNDVVLDGRKCGGILSEGRSAGATTQVVVGVGIDVNRPEHVPDDIAGSAAWLSDATGAAIDRTVLLAQILRTYETTFDRLVAAPEQIVATWADRSGLRGRNVTVRAVDRSIIHEGSVIEVAPDGALVLESGGRIVRVLLGDVEVLS